MQPGEPLAAGYLLDGRYRINRVLGSGGMGRVYLANDTRLAHRPVAVKEMVIGDNTQERKAVEDFAREARVLAVLSHPGIPRIIDYFVEHGRHYLVMEFVAGGDLQAMLDKLGQGGRLAEAQVLRWSHQILDVLEFLHAQTPPIVYRDLKPGNIMIDKDGRAMLIDFGIARFLPPAGGRGTQIGSIGYAPPEQYTGKVEPRSDLYALGATMHHLLTGRDPQLAPPFAFPPVRQLAPEVSPDTDRVVMWALMPDLNKRPASAHEMKAALPQPPAEEAVGGTGFPSSMALPKLSTMATVVLTQPAPAGEAPSPQAEARKVYELNLSHLPTQRDIAAPFVPAAPPATPSPRASAPSPPPPSGPGKPLPPVSPTAKTQELQPLPAVSPAPTGSKFRTPAKPSGQPRPVGARTGTGGVPRVAAPRGSKPVTPPSPSARAVRPSAAPVIPSIGPTKATPPPSVATAKPPTGAARGIAPPQVNRRIEGHARLIAHPEGWQFPLNAVRSVIGRGAAAGQPVDIDLSRLKRAGRRVAERHAEVVCEGGSYFIRDLGSSAGTYVAEGRRLGRDQLYRLKNGDRVMVGDVKLEFREDRNGQN